MAPAIGIKDVEISLGDFALEHGGVLKDDIVQGRLYGREGAPLVVVPGGISASRFVADGVDGKDGSGGWWYRSDQMSEWQEWRD